MDQRDEAFPELSELKSNRKLREISMEFRGMTKEEMAADWKWKKTKKKLIVVLFLVVFLLFRLGIAAFKGEW